VAASTAMDCLVIRVEQEGWEWCQRCGLPGGSPGLCSMPPVRGRWSVGSGLRWRVVSGWGSGRMSERRVIRDRSTRSDDHRSTARHDKPATERFLAFGLMNQNYHVLTLVTKKEELRKYASISIFT
jgi:hypothetical protein